MPIMEPTHLPQEFHFTIDTNEQTLVSFLAAKVSMSQQEIKTLLPKGAVWHQRGQHVQRVRRAKKALQVGDQIHFYYNPAILQQTVADAVLVCDEQHYSVWYKPFAMLCQGSKWSDHTTINRFVETHLQPQRPAFIVHRLDKATTGLIVIAHSKSAAKQLSKAFEDRQTRKVYQAIVHGDHRQFKQPQTINDKIDDKQACSHVRCLEYNSTLDRSLVEVHIETGRKHQIRKHLAGVGLPIVGDRLHGEEGKGVQTNLDLQLCAVSLSLPIIDALNQDLALQIHQHTPKKEYVLAHDLQLTLA